MKHFHGTPIGGTRQDAARFLIGRHALVPLPRQDDMGIVAEACQSFVFDNGAFSVWKRGEVLDVPGYMAWVREWCRADGEAGSGGKRKQSLARSSRREGDQRNHAARPVSGKRIGPRQFRRRSRASPSGRSRGSILGKRRRELPRNALSQPRYGPLVATLQRVNGKTPHQLREAAEKERDALRAKVNEMERQEPVAEIGQQYTLLFAGSGSITGVVKRHGLKIGDKLYALPGAQPAPSAPEFCPCCGNVMRACMICPNEDCNAVTATAGQAKYNKQHALARNASIAAPEVKP